LDIPQDLVTEIILLDEISIDDKIVIIRELFNQKTNNIFIGTDYGYLNLSDPPIFDQSIYAKVIAPGSSNRIYQNLAQQLKINNIINTNVLILPYRSEYQTLLNQAFSIVNQINVNDPELATNISISVANRNSIQNISEKTNNFVSLRDPNILNLMLEYQINKQNNLSILETPNGYQFNNPKIDLLMFYQNNNYIYYPFMDIMDESFLEDFIDQPDSINTNGRQRIINQSYQLIKRFDDYQNGVFVKRKSFEQVIPTIVHML
jgi:hypothetical protein